MRRQRGRVGGFLRHSRNGPPDPPLRLVDDSAAEPIRPAGPGADDVSGLRRVAALTWGFPRRGRGFWFSVAIDLLWPVLVFGTRLRFRGRAELSRRGGVLVATNHLSFADPITVTAFCLAAGRVPRYLAKASLWRLPMIGRVMASGGHIPVHRNSTRAGDAYRDAVAAAARGECVVFFPEGGFSRRDDGWPSTGKSGVARVALETGTPVIPVANWGTHHVLPSTAWWPRLVPRRRIEVVAGPPVDLSDLTGGPMTRENLELATARIMAAVTALLAGVRGEPAPSAVDPGRPLSCPDPAATP